MLQGNTVVSVIVDPKWTEHLDFIGVAQEPDLFRFSSEAVFDDEGHIIGHELLAIRKSDETVFTFSIAPDAMTLSSIEFR